MPNELKVNEISTNNGVFIFDKPKRLTPNSSGSGEAMIKAPSSQVSHLKSLDLNTALNFASNPPSFMSDIKSVENLSLIKRNISKSPATAPRPPKNAVSASEFVLAISASVTAAGATVNIDVKNIPATKPPIILNEAIDLIKSGTAWILTKIIASATLEAMIARSCIKWCL